MADVGEGEVNQDPNSMNYKRHGATALCGCWCWANPGSLSGDMQICPAHGLTKLHVMNVPEPCNWIASWRHQTKGDEL